MSEPVTKKNTHKEVALLARSIGNFIRYWGFRRIHGQIWTQVYLSKVPLSGADLTRLLKVSKALVSPALGELLKHRLIETAGGDKKTKFYIANPNVIEVVKGVLVKREKILLESAKESFKKLDVQFKSGNGCVDGARLENVGAMITAGSMGLDAILENMTQESLSMWTLMSKAST